MTTSANPVPTPTEPDASPSELSELWRAIGRLEGTANALLDGQREVKEGQQELRAEFKADLREVHRRIDRILYAIIGIGGALLVSVYASRFIGG